jgi:hypothetical protein
METSTKVNGMTAKLTDMGSTLIKMVQCIKVNGLMINITEKVSKPGTMGLSNMRVIFLKQRNQEKVDSNLMVISMRVTSKTDSLKDKENTTLLTPEKFIKENFMKITLLGMV